MESAWVVIVAFIIIACVGIWAEFAQGQEIERVVKAVATDTGLAYRHGLLHAGMFGKYRNRQLNVEVRMIYGVAKWKRLRIRVTTQLNIFSRVRLRVSCDKRWGGLVRFARGSSPLGEDDLQNLFSVECRPPEFTDRLLSSERIRQQFKELYPCQLIVSATQVLFEHELKPRLENPTQEQLLFAMDTTNEIAIKAEAYTAIVSG